MAYSEAGEGPSVLFLHGFPLDRTMWRHQLGAVAGWRGVAPDLRGMGSSPVPSGGYAMEAYAEDLRALLDRMRVDRVVVCGLSMGGYVAFECLRRFPERIAGLVLMDTRSEADSGEARAGRDRLIAETRAEGAGAVVNAMLPRLVGATTAAAAPEVVEDLRAMMRRAPLAGIVGALEAMRDRPDSRHLLAALDGMPTLVVVGAEDVVTPPAVAESMAAAIPGATLEVIAGAGHLPPLERPADVTTVLRRFLGSHVQLSGGVGRL